MNTIIRHANVNDVPAMAALINEHAERGAMLHRSHQELYDQLRDFQVACADDRLIGVCGLRIMWANLAEVYALAIDSSIQRSGFGRALVLAAVEDARTLGISTVFTLTYVPTFFERCKFAVANRSDLPLKVWSECFRCPKRECCDEVAMIRGITDVPEITETKPAPDPQQFEVIVPTVSVRKPSNDAK